MKHVYQRPSHTRHDDELGTGTYEDIERPTGQNAEVVGGQGQSHGQHNNAQNDCLRVATHPIEDVGEEESKHSDTNHKGCSILCQPS